jgi:curli biogenesis system outer membrane secretion channel CsgG
MRTSRLGLLLGTVIASVIATEAWGQKGPSSPGVLSGTQGLPRVAVVGLPQILADRIIEHLTLGKRFLPVERGALGAALSEQRFGKPPRQTYLDRTLDKAIKDMDRVEGPTVWATGTLAAYNDLLKELKDLGTAVGAHYLVLGHLEKLSRTSESVPIPYLRGRTLTRVGHDARLRLRIVDVKTATVIGATSFRLQVSDDLFQGKVSDRDEHSFLDDIGRVAATAVLDVAFPARLIRLNPMVVSRGANDGVQQGDRFDIQREGDELRGETGAVIGRLKSRIGQVEVIEAQENVSLVQPVEGRGFQVRDLAVTDLRRTGGGEGVPGRAAEAQGAPLRRDEPPSQLPRIAVGLIRSGSTAAEERKNIAVFTDTIISRLTQTRRFRVMDRQEVEQLLTEQLAQALEQGRGLKSAMGSLKGVDYMAFGSVAVFALEKEVTKLPGSTRTFEQQVGRVEGNLRIVDARSGEIRESRKVPVRKELAASAEKTRLVTNLADAFAEEVVAVLMHALYPIKVVAVAQDGTVYINRGDDGGLAKGEQLRAYRPGKAIVDADTGVRLGTEETEVGEVVIHDVEDARSKGAVVSGRGVAVGDVLKRDPAGRPQGSAPIARAPESSRPSLPTPGKGVARTGRPTLAVGTFRIAAAGRTEAITPAHLPTLTNELIVKLTNTNRFQLMDRQEVDQLLDEKAFQAASSGTNIKAYLGQLAGADYLILGEISKFSLEERRVPVVNELRTMGVGEGTLRVVEVARGAVVAAEKVRVEARVDPGAQRSGDVSGLIDRFTTEAVVRVVGRIYATTVIGVQPDGTVYINRGADANLQVGTVFDVMRPGAEMRDPQTGLSFGAAETHVGSIEIVAVEAVRSRGRMVSGQTPSIGDLLRPPTQVPPARKDSGEPKAKPAF